MAPKTQAPNGANATAHRLPLSEALAEGRSALWIFEAGTSSITVMKQEGVDQAPVAGNIPAAAGGMVPKGK
jgi:hypothetical protein